MDKRMSAKQVVSELDDGMVIGIGGWGPRRKPMALVREILKSTLKDLTVVSYGGPDVGMLCAAGKIKKLIFSFVSLDFIALEPYFRQARQKGNIETLEIDEGLLLLGLRAAAWGCPYIPTQIGLGTDVVTVNQDLKLIDSPYDDKEWLAMRALNLDASLIHVERADLRGVCQIRSADHYMDDWFARAAKKTYVSCDELVETEYFSKHDEARYVWWERAVTDAVIPVPGGAHPSACSPFYGYDESHLKTYTASAKSEGFSWYFKKFIENKTENQYQELVGGLSAIRALPQPIY